MRGIVGQNARTIVTSAIVAAVTAAVMATVPALARPAAPAGNSIPFIDSQSKSLVTLNSSAAKAAFTVTLPAGNWTIFLRADASTLGATADQINCELVAGKQTNSTPLQLGDKTGHSTRPSR